LSKIHNEIDINATIDSIKIMPNKAFGMMNVLIDKNIEFITNSMVVFICGCNLVCYDLDTEESRFLKRRYRIGVIRRMSIF
jgi:hypothetical protein